jgi:ABC-type sulfate/molybdate transport systems ATPase subunit
MRLIKRMSHERGVTLVIVTHDDRILPFADRILRLEDGRITREEKARGPASPLITELLSGRTRALDRAASRSPGALGQALAASVHAPLGEPAAVADATHRIVVRDEAAASPTQIVISNACSPSLATEGIIVSCGGRRDSRCDPGVLETPSEVALASETTAVRS